MNIADISTVYKEAKILTGVATTEAIELEHGHSLVGVFHPIINTSSAFKFLVSELGVDYVQLEDGAGGVQAVGFDNTVAGFTPVYLPFVGFRFLKIIVDDVQLADRVLRLAVRPLAAQ